MIAWRKRAFAIGACVFGVALGATLFAVRAPDGTDAAANTVLTSRDVRRSRAGQIDSPPVQVKVTKLIPEPGRVIYRYTIVNGSAFPITGVSIGNDDYYDETELGVAPLGWHGDSVPQTPPSSVESPPNWSFKFIQTEGGEPGTADWRPANPGEGVMGGNTLSGFAVVLPQEHAPYEAGHWTAYLNTDEEIVYSGALQPSGVTAVPMSSVFAKSDLQIKPNPTRGPVSIQFAVPVTGMTTVDVYDAQGRLVKRVLKKQLSASNATISWEGRDEVGRQVAAGVYFVRVKTPSTVRFARITWVK